MSTYKDLLAQREQLEKQIAEARQTEMADAVAKVRELIDQFGLTPEDLFAKPRRSANAGTKVPPKYRHPATGSTWTGRGKPPKWYSEASEEQRSTFIIA